MRKKAIVLLLILAFSALALVLAPPVSAKNLKCDQVIVATLWPNPSPDPRHVNDSPFTDENGNPIGWGYWKGRVDFGGGMKGTAYFCGDPTGVPPHGGATGKVGHFFEDFYIAFDGGGYAMGKDEGVYLYLTNWMYMANGWVTGASANYAFLVGCKYHEEGKTTDPMDPTATETVGTGVCFLAGA